MSPNTIPVKRSSCSTVVAAGPSLANCDKQSLSEGSAPDPLTKNCVSRRSRRFREAVKEARIFRRRPSSPWPAVGRFLDRWPSIRRRFSRNNHHRANSDSALGPGKGTGDGAANVQESSEAKDVRAGLVSSRNNPRHSEGDRVVSVNRFQQYKVVSKVSGSRYYSVALDTGSSVQVCKEYISRLKCYDVMPQWTEIIAIDSKTPLDKVFHILRLRQRAITATVWDSAENTVQGMCDVRQLFRSFWQDQTVSRLTNLGERMSKPFSEFFYRGPNGVPAESKLIEAAQLIIEDVSNRSFFQPLLNEGTGDVVGIVSALDILRFLSRQLHKFHLLSVFDHISISDIQSDCWYRSSSEESNTGMTLEPTMSINEAIDRLFDSKHGILPVMKLESLGSAPKLETVVSIVDIIDFIIRHAGPGRPYMDRALGKTLRELLVRMPKKALRSYHMATPLSTVLKDLAVSYVLPLDFVSSISIIVDDNRDFLGFLQAENVLQTVLSLDGDGTLHRVHRSDSGVGDDSVFELTAS